MDRVALVAELSQAFAGTSRNPELSLHQAHLSDQGMSRQIGGAEWRAAGKLDFGRRWEDVPGVALDECDSALSHLDPEGWRFYLPAFIRRALEHFAPPSYPYEKLCSVLFHLTYTPESSPHVLPRFELLTDAQRTAVRHFLELAERETLAFVEATNDQWWTYESAKCALDSYWRSSDGEP